MTMAPMLDPASVDALNGILTLGARRHPAPLQKAFGGLTEADDPKAVLKALALLGQHNRFRRSARRESLQVGPLFADERAIVPDAVRPLLRALFAGKFIGDCEPAAI